ncbi:MAG TPA: flagellar hook-associated protein FlgK [Planctomycetota bacterium]|nr:flagellar hook-associated protein FlgK [Planctomycetota bacterium]
MGNISLNTGLRALIAAQYSLDTVGQNLANANTPGYSRQVARLATALPLQRGQFLLGNGVEVRSVSRHVDALLERRILGQTALAGRFEAQMGEASSIEALFGELEGQALGDALDGLFTKASTLASDPVDTVARTAMVQAAVELAARFGALDGGLKDAGGTLALSAQAVAVEVNQLAARVASLNAAIAETEAVGVEANDLRDERQLALEDLGRLVDITTQDDGQNGLRVMVAGNVLVSGDEARKLSVDVEGGVAKVRIEGAAGLVPVEGGELAGLLDLRDGFVPELRTRLDALAKSLILELNRRHSTGVPQHGGFEQLTATNAVVDRDNDGKLLDELLSKSGLPFDVASGELVVNVTDAETGALEKHTLAISAGKTTVGQFVAALDGLDHLSAGLDAKGRLQISADEGFRFDFSARLDTNPDPFGAFGSGKASLGTPAAGPFALADGDTLQITVPAGAGTTTVLHTFAQAEFADITEATAEEVAASLAGDPAFAAAGLEAHAVDGHLFLQTAGEGAGSQFTLDGGTALAGLGIAGFATQTVSGTVDGAAVTVGGAYAGEGNHTWSFVPQGDGTVGTTPGLAVDVLDEQGQLVATLQVGEGYQPGEALAVADGVTVAFGLGELSATHNDRFALDVAEDSDTTDVLVALGLNGLLEGHDAGTLSVRAELQADPSLLAVSTTGAPGGNGVLLELLELEDEPAEGLGASVAGFYGALVGDVGFEVASIGAAAEANALLLGDLEARRSAISGVNVDEELVDLVRFEQSYAAAARFIDTVNQLQEDLLRLL